MTSPFDDLLKPVDEHLIVHNELMSPLILGNRIKIHSAENGIPDLDSVKIALLGIPEERNSVDYLGDELNLNCLLYTSPSPRDRSLSRMPSSA